jgi:Fe-only nitrogenase accessory protein AnfO
VEQDTEISAAVYDIPLPVLIGDITEGHYSINLAEILQDNPALNSRQVLIPALEEKTFKKLEIICDHIPRWFNNELRNLKLTAELEVPDESGKWLKIVVAPK